MDIRARLNANCAILDVNGKFLSTTDAMELRNAVNEAVARQPRKIVLDLGRVSYIDSCGIGELVHSFLHVRSQGGRLTLVDLPKRVRELLVIAKLDTVLDIRENEQEAIADSGEDEFPHNVHLSGGIRH